MNKNDIDYTEGVPTEPPEGLIDYLYKNGCFDEEYLIYKAAYVTDPLTEIKEKCVEVVCTCCEESFYQEYVKNSCCNPQYASAPFGFINSITNEVIAHGTVTTCPCCGAIVTAKYTGNMRTFFTAEETYPLTIDVINGRLTLLCWHIRREIYKNGTSKIVSFPYEGYIADGRKMIKLAGYTKCFSSISYNIKWEQRKLCRDTLGGFYYDDIYPWNAEILEQTDAANCKLNVYLQSRSKERIDEANSRPDIEVQNRSKRLYPVTYLRIWQKHKNVENLIMQGAADIISDKIERGDSYAQYYRSDISGINWKEKRPHLMLGLTKAEFKFMTAEKWSAQELEFYIDGREHGLLPEDVRKYVKDRRAIRELFEMDDNIPKTLRYLEKQIKKYPGRERIINVDYIRDYWNMAKKNGDNISDNNIRYPQDLVRAHNTAVRTAKYKEDEKLMKMFEERYAVLSELNYQSGNLIIRAAESEGELIEEGKILHHCVASYAKRHAEGQTAIFFLRHSEDPEIPYFTLELDEKNLIVRQNRGIRNCGRTDEVIEFEKEWLSYIRTIKDKSKGEKENERIRIRKTA